MLPLWGSVLHCPPGNLAKFGQQLMCTLEQGGERRHSLEECREHGVGEPWALGKWLGLLVCIPITWATPGPHKVILELKQANPLFLLPPPILIMEAFIWRLLLAVEVGQR